jgi:hypothetical protein
MFNRRVVLMASGAFLGLVIAAGTVTSLSASVLSNRTEYLTFSGAVSLPGVTLNRGTYTFEMANSEASADIVRVRNRATNAVVFSASRIGLNAQEAQPTTVRSCSVRRREASSRRFWNGTRAATGPGINSVTARRDNRSCRVARLNASAAEPQRGRS